MRNWEWMLMLATVVIVTILVVGGVGAPLRFANEPSGATRVSSGPLVKEIDCWGRPITTVGSFVLSPFWTHVKPFPEITKIIWVSVANLIEGKTYTIYFKTGRWLWFSAEQLYIACGELDLEVLP